MGSPGHAGGQTFQAFSLVADNSSTADIQWTEGRVTFWLRNNNAIQCKVAQKKTQANAKVKGQKRPKAVEVKGVFTMATSWGAAVQDGTREEMELAAVGALGEYMGMMEV